MFNPISREEITKPLPTIIPTGWYQAKIYFAEERIPKSNVGYHLMIVLDLLSPPYEKIRTYAYLVMEHKNPKAVELGRWKLGKIMDALGLDVLNHLHELKDGRVSVKVVTKVDATFGTQYKIEDFGPPEDLPVPPATPTPQVDDDSMICEEIGRMWAEEDAQRRSPEVA